MCYWTFLATHWSLLTCNVVVCPRVQLCHCDGAPLCPVVQTLVCAVDPAVVWSVSIMHIE